MAGFGSPCGACKFLRRKCVRGCVFAPYFCHEQGAAHFSAVHRVFGASNVSKLLAHLPVTDRCEAAVTISYEAQARLQDPIYGCVSHIFALQQQVVNLQAQLASLKEQATQGYTANAYHQEKTFGKFPNNQHIDQSLLHQNHVNDTQTMLYNNNGFMDSIPADADYNNSTMCQDNVQFTGLEEPSYAMAAALDGRWTFQDTQELQSIAFSYIQNS